MWATQENDVWDINRSPLATVEMLDLTDDASGSIRFVVVRGRSFDGATRALGAIWVTEDEATGGFLAARSGDWAAAEMARDYEGARARGWSAERIFRYWSETEAGRTLTVEPISEAADLGKLRRLVAEAA